MDDKQISLKNTNIKTINSQQMINQTASNHEVSNPLGNNQLILGMTNFKKKIDAKIATYKKLIEKATSESDVVYHVTDKEMFNEVINNFAAVLDSKKAKYPLDMVYNISLHKPSGTLIISNKGATLYCLSPRTRTPYLVRHIGLCLYVPGLGIEFVNVGLVGNVYDGNVVLRSESACTPSFVFGSQRCNCSHQWDSIREIAAYFNRTKTPEISDGHEFEDWVQHQITYNNGKHLPLTNGPGFILMHLDTQNGMGSGYTKDEFSFDLFSKASMRHRGEYTAEQVHNISMYQGFSAIGLNADPRKENDNLGYKIIRIVLDYLNVSRDIIMLTNNVLKMKYLEENGYRIKRLKTFGEINAAGSQEAMQRCTEFDHMDINGDHVDFNNEFDRLKKELNKFSEERAEQ